MVPCIIESMRVGQRLKLLEEHPQYALAEGIIRQLTHDGFKTVLAGGCVRDSLLGTLPKDLDIATAAGPDVVEKTFPRTLAVGKDFGTIVVVEGGHNFEVTTFRSEGPYLDGRHPSSVSFTDMEEDAKRRDFTVNALFYDPLEREIWDFVGGREDMQKKCLRAVGNPEERFKEDRLRMLRAARFVAQLGFALDLQTAKAVANEACAITQVSAERIYNESYRLLQGKHLRAGLDVLLTSGLAKAYWPELVGLNLAELAKFPEFLNWENAFAAICMLNNIKDPEPRLRAWKVSRESLQRVKAQLSAIDALKDPKVTRADRARLFGGNAFAEILILAQGLFDSAKLDTWTKEFLEISAETGELPKPFISGEDLLRAGVKPGVEMGKLLKDLYDKQLEGRIRSREAAFQEFQKTKV